MKTSIIYLGIALVTFTNATRALDLEQSFEDENRNPQQTVQTASTSESILADSGRNGENLKSVELDLPIAPVYQKTIEEVMAEDSQIIESLITTKQIAEESTLTEIIFRLTPVPAEKTIEQTILEDSQIIESPMLTTMSPVMTGTFKKTESLQ